MDPADRSSFAALVAQHQNLVASVALATVGDRALSEDVAQEAFVKLWQNLGRLRRPDQVAAWLCTTTRNLSKNALRARKETPAVDPHEIDLADDATPFEALSERQREAVVAGALARVPAEYREVLILYYREDGSVERVAASLGLSADAVKQRLARGRQKLHDRLVPTIERDLRRSAPGERFTAVVVAAIAALGGARSAVAARRLPPARAGLVAGGGLALVALVAVVALLSGGGREPAPRPAGEVASATPTAAAPRAAARATDDPVGGERLEGLVLGPDDQPAGEATVVVDGEFPGATRVTAEADGSFAIGGLPGGRHSIRAVRGELASPVAFVWIDSDTEPLTLRLGASTSLEVRVVDGRDGAAVPSATVAIRGGPRDDREATVDDAGVARFEHITEPGLVAAWAPGMDGVSIYLKPASGGTEKVTLALLPGGSLTGRVIDSSGAPVVGASVGAELIDADGEGRQTYVPRVDTDDAGGFVMPSVAPGRYTIEATSAGYRPTRLERVTVAVGEVREVALTLRPGPAVVGVVVDAAGRPVEGADVRAIGARERWLGEAKSDRDGRFRIEGLDGPCSLEATRDRSISPRVAATPGGPSLRVRIEERSIRGRVLGTDGEPAVGIEVRASSDATTVSGPDGEFILAPLPDPSYQIEAGPAFPDEPDAAADAKVGDRDVVLRLVARAAVRGRVVGPDGRPVDEVLIKTARFDGGLAFQSGARHRGGAFTLALAPGHHVVELRVADFPPRRLELDVAAGGAIELGDLAIAPGRELAGRVVSEAGAPVPFAVVVHFPIAPTFGSFASVLLGRGGERAVTDADGRFHIRAVAGRSGLLQAYHLVHGRAEARVGQDERSIELTLEPEGIVRGRLLGFVRADRVSRPLEVVAIDAGRTFTSLVDADGRFALAAPPGSYRLGIRRPRCEDDLVDALAIAAGTVVERDLAVAPALMLELPGDLPGRWSAAVLREGTAGHQAAQPAPPADGPHRAELDRSSATVCFPRAPRGPVTVCLVGGASAAPSCRDLEVTAAPGEMQTARW